MSEPIEIQFVALVDHLMSFESGSREWELSPPIPVRRGYNHRIQVWENGDMHISEEAEGGWKKLVEFRGMPAQHVRAEDNLGNKAHMDDIKREKEEETWLYSLTESKEIRIEATSIGTEDRGPHCIEFSCVEVSDESELMSGGIRWDGCSNWNTDCLHFCSKEQAAGMGGLFAKLYEIAAELMPDHEHYLGDEKKR